ncbi:MAG: membrane protein insertase YidC [Desulfocapsa sp.]|nr:MAG: membrane protein insertase YidC [Desulfocapsa sp.]
MDSYKTVLGIIFSFLVLIGHQYLFTGSESTKNPRETNLAKVQSATAIPLTIPPIEAATTVSASTPATVPKTIAHPKIDSRNIIVDTDLYTATFSEAGGVLTSFVLKKYKEENISNSSGMQIIRSDAAHGYPLGFSWGSIVPTTPHYTSDNRTVEFLYNEANFRIKWQGNGLEIQRKYSFSKDSYLINIAVQVKNVSHGVLHGAAALHQFGSPAVEDNLAKRFLFSGPAYYAGGSKVEISGNEFKKGPLTIRGQADWTACECNYFMNAVLLRPGSMESLTVQSAGGDVVEMIIKDKLDTLQPDEVKTYRYKLYIGPKKLDVLQPVGLNLDKAINYGWFNSLSQLTLTLLNFFYSIVHNYGIAIILVTIIFKAMLWPLTRKGMQSMHNIQQLQPEVTKLKQKYKGESFKRNQAVAKLYKANRVNPLVGCFPMFFQIPVFFALYKVLFMSVELRHAPFMLWINDLSSPDRLYLGVDIPYVGGFPVLTLLMGASMFYQQKITATNAGPIQAKITMFIPVVFTVLFVNFASGLVLYWFVSNLLTIFQHYMITRQHKA